MKSSTIEDFWNKTRSDASQEQESGYLSDGWPLHLSMQRFAGEFEWIMRNVLPLLGEQTTCLDVGCGTGLWLENLAPLFERAEGFDLSEEMIVGARARLQKVGLDNVKLSVSKIENLDTSTKFDLIFVGGVLMYHNDEDLPQALETLRALLVPGGIVVFRESTYRKKTYYRDKPLARGLLSPPDAPRPRYRAVYRTTEILRKAIEQCGLEIVKVQANSNYKFVDMKKSQLRFVNRLLGQKLATDPEGAERWARRIHSARWLTCHPAYYLCRMFRIPAWNMDNHWFVCRL